jgi:C4-dicarboxylate-specific signal transduction histidine kinase
MIRIRDDGPGLDPDNRSQGSEIRNHGGSTSPELGAGLGLAISGDIVESFGGRLELGTFATGRPGSPDHTADQSNPASPPG